jgi:hypothetical protein
MHQLGLDNNSQILQTPSEPKKSFKNESPQVGVMLSALKGAPVEKKIKVLKENINDKKKMMTRSYSKNVIKKVSVMQIK